MEALGRHLRVLDETYGQAEARRYLSLSDATLDGAERLPLDRLAQWAADVVRQGKV